MRSCPHCSSSDLTRDGHDQCGRPIHACGACGRHATSESGSLVAGHRFPRDVILLAVRYSLQLGAAAERIAGLLADRGIDVSGRTILRWVQKFGPALAEEVRRHRKPVGRPGWWTRRTSRSKACGTTCTVGSTALVKCWIAGCRGGTVKLVGGPGRMSRCLPRFRPSCRRTAAIATRSRSSAMPCGCTSAST